MVEVLKVDYMAQAAPEQFAKTLKETGFAVLTNHPVDWNLIEKAYVDWHKFFNSDYRHNYKFDRVKQEGYVDSKTSEMAKGHAVKDIKEFYQMYYPWGRYPKEISDASRKLFEQTFALAGELLGWVEDNMPVELRAKLDRPLREMICVDRTQQRFLYYPAIQGDEPIGAIRAAAHEDINLITILPAATQPGLQVKAEGTNNEWVDVKVEPHSLVVNIGDMLQEATDHYYISTSHRVVKPAEENAGKPRLSIPMFLHPAADVKISSRYPRADLYLDERLHELGLMG